MALDGLFIGGLNVNDGITYYLGRAYSTGAGDIEQVLVESLLDGDQPAGGRAGNRQINIPIVVVAGTRIALAREVAAVSLAADQSQFSLTHSPDGGLPVVLDCFRAKVIKSSSFQSEKFAFVAQLDVSCEALPYARTPVQTVRSVVLGAGAGTQIDACDSLTVPGTVNAGVTLDTTMKVEGTASLTRSAMGSLGITRTFTTAQNFSTYALVSLAQRLYSNDEFGEGSGTTTFVLTDTSGRTATYPLNFGGSRFLFVRISADLANPSAISAGFSLAAIASYRVQFDANLPFDYTLWLDDVRGVPAATSLGRVVRINGVQGTARTTVNSCTITAPAAVTLKQVLVARWNGQPASFTPVVSAGTSTVDAAASDGTGVSTGTLNVELVSANFRPGSYAVWVLLRNAGSTTTITGQARVTVDNLPGGTLRYGSQTVTSAPVTATGVYELVFVGELELPGFPVAPTATAARTFLRLTGSTVTYDEIYLLPSDADVTVLRGIDDLKVQLTALNGNVTSYAGSSAANLTGVGDRQVTQGNLLLRPGDNDILVVANGQTTGGPMNATVDLAYNDRWHFERAV